MRATVSSTSTKERRSALANFKGNDSKGFTIGKGDSVPLEGRKSLAIELPVKGCASPMKTQGGVGDLAYEIQFSSPLDSNISYLERY